MDGLPIIDSERNDKLPIAERARLLLVIASVLALALSAVDARPVHAAFPGTPGLIAVEEESDRGFASDIWLFDLQTGGARRLRHHRRTYQIQPAFSPDGQSLAFIRSRNVWVVGVDDTGARRLTKLPRALGAEEPAFSADGSWVAFSGKSLHDETQIDRVSIRGGRPRVLVRAKGAFAMLSSPTYSPDGQHLAWGKETLGLDSDWIYMGNAQGGDARRLIRGKEPEFSPDGRSLAYLTTVRCSAHSLGEEIDTILLETGQTEHITRNCGSEVLKAPTYSPDGGWLAYSSSSKTRSRIKFSPVPGGVSQIMPPAELNRDFPILESLSWQPLP